MNKINNIQMVTPELLTQMEQDFKFIKYDPRAQGHQVDIIWLDEEMCEDMNDPHFEMLINEFVNQQDFFSINPNGKIERNVIINEFNKFCYINKYSCSLKRDEITEMVKDEYWKRHETKLNKQDFFESLKPQKFKYRW